MHIRALLLPAASDAVTSGHSVGFGVEAQSVGHCSCVHERVLNACVRCAQIICLRNMVSHDEVDSQLEDEITDECSKYGSVQKVRPCVCVCVCVCAYCGHV